MKLATAKRSSRIAGKVERQKHIEEAEEVERKRLADIKMAKLEQEKQRKLEEVYIPSQPQCAAFTDQYIGKRVP